MCENSIKKKHLKFEVTFETNSGQNTCIHHLDLPYFIKFYAIFRLQI